MSDQPDALKEPAATYGLDLPVAPAWFSDPPPGSVDDGIRLSLAALEQAKGRSEIFRERDRQRCLAEFKI